jgi:pectate lyase
MLSSRSVCTFPETNPRGTVQRQNHVQTSTNNSAENGGSLSNVIIGPNQIEGIHCQGACTLTNVWWSEVCEDAFTIKHQDAGATTYIKGGGAFGATDKVMQHNGGGTLSISNFFVSSFGKLYRSCGNCKTQVERHVVMNGITANKGEVLAGMFR